MFQLWEWLLHCRQQYIQFQTLDVREGDPTDTIGALERRNDVGYASCWVVAAERYVKR